jgi:hypothetical protein
MTPSCRDLIDVIKLVPATSVEIGFQLTPSTACPGSKMTKVSSWFWQKRRTKVRSTQTIPPATPVMIGLTALPCDCSRDGISYRDWGWKPCDRSILKVINSALPRQLVVPYDLHRLVKLELWWHCNELGLIVLVIPNSEVIDPVTACFANWNAPWSQIVTGNRETVGVAFSVVLPVSYHRQNSVSDFGWRR